MAGTAPESRPGSRPSQRGPARAGRTRRPRPALLPHFVGVASGVLLIAAAFLPWYAADIAPPFQAVSASGWDATVFARLAAICGGLVAVGSAVPVLGSGHPALTAGRRTALGFAVAGLAVLAAALVAFRLVVLPDPADLLSRQIGLYAAALAAAGCVLAGVGQAAGRSGP
ncbi:MAG: hypothetical protein RIB67_07155 [Miltoncostaeaceae bacterium]